jgi:hypothetical protein
MVDLAELAEDALRVRRTILAGIALALGPSALAPVAAIAAIVVAGVVAPQTFPALPGAWVGVGFALVASSSAAPWILLMLAGSAWYHARLARTVDEAGFGPFAQGFRAAARRLAAPVLLAVVLVLAAAALIAVWPEPRPGSWTDLLVGVAVLASPLVGPIVGLWLGRRAAYDLRVTRVIRRDGPVAALEAGLLPARPGPFPLIDGRPAPVVRAEALRRVGDLAGAETTIRAHLAEAGLGPVAALTTLARTLRDAGRLDEAERAAVAAVRVLPFARSGWSTLAEIEESRGLYARAAEVRAAAATVRAGPIRGLVPIDPAPRPSPG